MFWGIWNRLFGAWPSGVPRLYPDLGDVELARFISAEEFDRIKRMENFYILPFISGGTHEELAFGLGLSQLMIRNLMLLADVSVHGPEDTPQVPRESAAALSHNNPLASYVTGLAAFNRDGFALLVEVYRRGVKTQTRVSDADFHAFLAKATAAIANLMNSGGQTTVPDAWRVGQPADLESLLQLGAILLADADDMEGSRAVERALRGDPNFVVPLWHASEKMPGYRRLLLEALRRDPYNAQLCFEAFCQFWTSKGPQPEAFQYCRRAVELSPGHGKAHMCTPHTGPDNVNLLDHSELGYRLLPGNAFAVNNYTTYLLHYGAPTSKLIELTEEALEMDPCDPGTYNRLIQYYLDARQPRRALAIAERLQTLYEPTYNERALYCLRQNPEQARRLATGEYNPAKENRQLISELRREVDGK